MRVNLSYSVELEDVLAELTVLFSREKEKFILADRVAMNTLKDEFTDDRVQELNNTIEKYKEAIFNFDVKLSEIQQILKGYHDIISAPAPNPLVETEEKIEEISLGTVDDNHSNIVSSLELQTDDEA